MGSEEPHKGRDFEIRYKTKDFWKIVWAHIRLTVPTPCFCWGMSTVERICFFQEMFLEEEFMSWFCKWPALNPQKSWFIFSPSIPSFYGNISVFALGVGQELRRRTDIGKWIYPLSRCKRVSKLLNFRRNIFIDLLAENLMHFWNADFHSENVFKIMKYVVVDIFVT